MITKGLSIIVINYGRIDLVTNFLDSICNSSDSGLIDEVIIVDNGYPQKGDSREVVDASSFPFKIQFVQNPESSYASGVNRGVALATGEILLIANNDVELLPNCSIQPLLDYLWREPRIGIVGPQQVYPDGSWQRSYGRFPSLKEAIISLTMLDSAWNGIRKILFRYNWLDSRPKEVDYIDGAFMIIRRSCFEELNGFDESYSFYGEDRNFCWRAYRTGWKAVFVPTVRVKHLRGASSTMESFSEFTTRYFKAKQKSLKESLGFRRSGCYIRLMKAAMLERALVYTFISKLVLSSNWRNRAQQAREAFKAVRSLCKEINECEHL